MNYSDEEIANDDNNQDNKIACSTEKTLDKLTGEGMTRNELMTFEAQIKGTSVTITFGSIVFL